MSDHIIKIIPADPYFRLAEHKALELTEFLKSRIEADSIDALIHETPVFVDCGGNLERILCPFCKSALGFDWWGKAMNASYEHNFEKLSVTLPCCGRESSLNDLRYDFPCGFSSIEFSILNPRTELEKDCLDTLQELIGTPVRKIHAHM